MIQHQELQGTVKSLSNQDEKTNFQHASELQDLAGQFEQVKSILQDELQSEHTKEIEEILAKCQQEKQLLHDSMITQSGLEKQQLQDTLRAEFASEKAQLAEHFASLQTSHSEEKRMLQGRLQQEFAHEKVAMAGQFASLQDSHDEEKQQLHAKLHRAFSKEKELAVQTLEARIQQLEQELSAAQETQNEGVSAIVNQLQTLHGDAQRELTDAHEQEKQQLRLELQSALEKDTTEEKKAFKEQLLLQTESEKTALKAKYENEVAEIKRTFEIEKKRLEIELEPDATARARLKSELNNNQSYIVEQLRQQLSQQQDLAEQEKKEYNQQRKAMREYYETEQAELKNQLQQLQTQKAEASKSAIDVTEHHELRHRLKTSESQLVLVESELSELSQKHGELLGKLNTFSVKSATTPTHKQVEAEASHPLISQSADKDYVELCKQYQSLDLLALQQKQELLPEDEKNTVNAEEKEGAEGGLTETEQAELQRRLNDSEDQLSQVEKELLKLEQSTPKNTEAAKQIASAATEVKVLAPLAGLQIPPSPHGTRLVDEQANIIKNLMAENKVLSEKQQHVAVRHKQALTVLASPTKEHAKLDPYVTPKKIEAITPEKLKTPARPLASPLRSRRTPARAYNTPKNNGPVVIPEQYDSVAKLRARVEGYLADVDFKPCEKSAADFVVAYSSDSSSANAGKGKLQDRLLGQELAKAFLSQWSKSDSQEKRTAMRNLPSLTSTWNTNPRGLRKLGEAMLAAL